MINLLPPLNKIKKLDKGVLSSGKQSNYLKVEAFETHHIEFSSYLKTSYLFTQS